MAAHQGSQVIHTTIYQACKLSHEVWSSGSSGMSVVSSFDPQSSLRMSVAAPLTLSHEVWSSGMSVVAPLTLGHDVWLLGIFVAPLTSSHEVWSSGLSVAPFDSIPFYVFLALRNSELCFWWYHRGGKIVFRVSGCLLKLCGDNELGGNR